MQNIAADIPFSLREADELLAKYGRWAKDRRRLHRCGSAEGRYVAPPNDDDRQPSEVIMSMPDAMACQRALARVPQQERIVLAVLYIPKRIPAEIQLRRLGIPPRLSRERHLLGLRMWWNKLRLGVDLQ
jgi:hypothetical protein